MAWLNLPIKLDTLFSLSLGLAFEIVIFILYFQVGYFSWSFFVIVVALSGLFATQFWLYRRFILVPLTMIRDWALQLAIGNHRAGQKIPPLLGREWCEVMVALNALSADLQRNQELLAEQIKEHTANFRVAIEQLEREIGERQHMLIEMQERARELTLLNTAIEQATESVVITNLEGNILYVNPAFERVTGYSKVEVMGQNPRLLKSGQQDAAFYQELWHTLTSGLVWHGRFVNKKKDGSLYTEEGTITPVRAESGAITHYVSVKRDVTQALQLEEEARQAHKMEAIGRLTGGIVHDFNNVLMVINGYADFLLNQQEVNKSFRDDLEQIRKAGQRAASLTRQLLAFSRKQWLQPQALNLNTVIADLEKMLRRMVGEDIEVVTNLSPNLGQVKADLGQLEQVILNLAANAREAMPDGGKLIIETANTTLNENGAHRSLIATPGSYVMLTVTDTGVGMDEETLAHIFEPFFTTKSLGQGTGLGLATVHGIVKQSEGEIWVSSQPGQGATFKIYLPRLTTRSDFSQAATDCYSLPGGQETILLVEDEASVRTMISLTLSQLGYTVLEAANSQDALRLCQTQAKPIDLVLTDVILPGMNGCNLVENLILRYTDLKVLYMSGYTSNVITRHGILREGMPFLQKPFALEILAHKVRRVLDEGQLPSEQLLTFGRAATYQINTLQ
ncbi:MAG: PAS domain S-box protein [Anaerolineae bacterium]